MTYLIGANGWNPVGESMWSIMGKLAHFNYMLGTDVDHVFCSRPSGFNRISTDLSKDHGFSTEQIAKYTGWELSTTDASFEKFYRPTWLKTGGNDIPIAGVLRICPKCAEAGQHLFIHQILTFLKCPIHHVELIKTCLNCGGRNLFSFSGTPENWLKCCHCKKLLLSPIKPDEATVLECKTFLREYSDWMTQLASAFGDDGNHYLWLGGPDSYFHLAFAHRLIPGPDWMDNCFTHISRVTHKRHILRNTTCRMPKRKKVFTVGNPYAAGVFKRNLEKGFGYFFMDSQELVHERYHERFELMPENARHHWAIDIQAHVKAVNNELYQNFYQENHEAAICDFDSNQCNAMYGPGCSIWSNAYWLWRRCMDAAFPWDQRWERRRDLSFFTEAFPWAFWCAGPGALLWSSQKDCQRYWNTGLVRRMTDIWFRQSYLDCYFLFLGMACPTVRAFKLSPHFLFKELGEVGVRPGWVLEDSQNGLVLHHLSLIADPTAFLKLRETGYLGLDAVYEEDPMALLPISRLLNVLPWQGSLNSKIKWSSILPKSYYSLHHTK